jgi:hypothetical protein
VRWLGQVCVVLAACACAREPARTDGRDASDSRMTTSKRPDATLDATTAEPAIIGRARMLADGTIVLALMVPAHAQLTYPPSHPQYASVLSHLGGMKPGEEKPVPPWPDPFDPARVEAAAHAHAASVGWVRSDYEVRITGTDSKTGRVVVTLGHADDKRARAPGGGRSLQLRIDPKTYAVIDVLRFQ